MNTVPNPDTNPERIGDAHLAVGDKIWTGGVWEPVTDEPTTDADGVVYVPTTRDGSPRTRTFARGELVRVQRRPAPHPPWCSPVECTAGRIASYHKSTRIPFGSGLPGAAGGYVQLWQLADEPLDAGHPSLVITFNCSTYLPDVRAYDLEAPDAFQLLDALTVLAADLPEGGAR